MNDTLIENAELHADFDKPEIFEDKTEKKAKPSKKNAVQWTYKTVNVKVDLRDLIIVDYEGYGVSIPTKSKVETSTVKVKTLGQIGSANFKIELI